VTATLIGSFSLGDSIPGLSDTLDTVGNGLAELKSSVDSVTGEIGNLASTINGLAASVDAATAELVAGPFGAARDQLDQIKGSLERLNNVPDATAYLAGITASLAEAIDLLNGLVPDDYLADQIAAVQGAIDNTEAALDDFENTLKDLTAISDDIRKQTALLNDLDRALSDAADAAIEPLAAYTEQVSQLLNSGVSVVHYTGSLSSLGGEVDAVLPGSGIGSSEQVTAPLLVVQTANTATLAALKDVFGIG
jgi:ABC-type transporter Mla subunit MlaD